ncbi:MAG: VacB/RNase II family 3'-5' exoribonuclease [Verrucomicrobia bacterium]|nr:VacB/RNase II family 3'-5' exoribonuclease [Verrucomicrobiota bacterium]
MKKKKKNIEPEFVTGTLRIHPRGFGFVQPEHPLQFPQEIFIPKQLTDNAVDGDLVEVEVNPSPHSEKGPDGKIIAVLKRGRTHLAGTVRKIEKSGALVYCPILGSDKPVLIKNVGPMQLGDRIILKVLRWGDDQKMTEGEKSHFLGNIANPTVDIPAAIEEFELRNSFPKGAILQAQKWGDAISPKDAQSREDFTEIPTVTIDPETAKDFDDALSITKDKKGNFHLMVHIADVAHYVPEGSPLDLEAIQRCNSTYFPGFCLPMLPHELSSNLCSLKPHVDRLTVSVLMDFDTKGNLTAHRICRSVIHSDHRFSYEGAKEVLDGKQKSQHLKMLQHMTQLCALLKEKRSGRGSIDFALPELVLLVNDKGEPHGTKVVEYDVTHQMVEEFMLKANEIVALHLTEKGKQLLFRIHEEPQKENIEEFYDLARSFGFALPKEPTQQDLQALFEKAKSTPFGHQLSVAFIRSMKLAQYSSQNIGHYGLALEHYTHFTSPIRRYIDLVIQRLLFNEEGKETDIDYIARHCSEQERISFRAESSVKLLKKLRLLKKWHEDNQDRIYSANITRIKPFGIFFEITDLMLEGFIHISELGDDYFEFHPETAHLTGNHTGTTFRLGQSISVRPLLIDLITLETEWELFAKSKRKRRRKK